MCSFQFSSLSTSTPRNFIDFDLKFWPHCSIWVLFIISLIVGVVFSNLVLKIMNFVFPGWRLNLLISNQFEICVNSKLQKFSRWLRLLELYCKVVSSANRFMSNFVVFGRSLIYIIKRRGPRIEPCGTPQRITSKSDIVPLTSVAWVRLDK